MVETADKHLLATAARIRFLGEQIAAVIVKDEGDGYCISDLQELMYELRPVVADLEKLERIPSQRRRASRLRDTDKGER